MKILMVTQKVVADDPILGFTGEWIKALAGKIEKLTVVTLEYQKTEWPANIEIYSLGKEEGASRRQRFFRLFSFAQQQLPTHNFDLIFCHMCPSYVIFFSPYSKALKIPLTLWYAHGQQTPALKLALRLSNRIFTPSSLSFPLPSSKVAVLGHGIPTSQFDFPLQEKNGEINIVTIGRISERKDLLTFLKAAAEIVENRLLAKPKFYIIGSPLNAKDKLYFTELKKFSRSQQLDSLIEFVPACSSAEIKKWYALGDIFVNTSLTGSLDKVILEAMAARKPIITSNRAGIEILQPLSPLFTFSAGNFEALTQNIMKWLALTAPVKQDLLNNLRQIVVENHDLSRWAEKIVQEFSQLIKSKNEASIS